MDFTFWFIAVLVSSVTCGILGFVIGQDKNQAGLGAALGFLLGPIGVLIAVVLPKQERGDTYTMIQPESPFMPLNDTSGGVRCENCGMRIPPGRTTCVCGFGLPSPVPRVMVKCRKCGTEVNPEDKFCPKCGARSTGCTKCGGNVPKGALFCPSCGEKVEG